MAARPGLQAGVRALVELRVKDERTAVDYLHTWLLWTLQPQYHCRPLVPIPCDCVTLRVRTTPHGQQNTNAAVWKAVNTEEHYSGYPLADCTSHGVLEQAARQGHADLTATHTHGQGDSGRNDEGDDAALTGHVVLTRESFSKRRLQATDGFCIARPSVHIPPGLFLIELDDDHDEGRDAPETTAGEHDTPGDAPTWCPGFACDIVHFSPLCMNETFGDACRVAQEQAQFPFADYPLGLPTLEWTRQRAATRERDIFVRTLQTRDGTRVESSVVEVCEIFYKTGMVRFSPLWVGRAFDWRVQQNERCLVVPYYSAPGMGYQIRCQQAPLETEQDAESGRAYLLSLDIIHPFTGTEQLTREQWQADRLELAAQQERWRAAQSEQEAQVNGSDGKVRWGGPVPCAGSSAGDVSVQSKKKKPMPRHVRRRIMRRKIDHVKLIAQALASGQDVHCAYAGCDAGGRVGWQKEETMPLQEQPPKGFNAFITLRLRVVMSKILERLQRWKHAAMVDGKGKGTGTANGSSTAQSYVKKERGDNLVPSDVFFALQCQLKAVAAVRYCDKWEEKTDPKKHVYEDIGICAFLVPLLYRLFCGLAETWTVMSEARWPPLTGSKDAASLVSAQDGAGDYDSLIMLKSLLGMDCRASEDDATVSGTGPVTLAANEESQGSLDMWAAVRERVRPPSVEALKDVVLLDMGCGNGLLVDLLVRCGWLAIGLDLQARRSWTKHDLYCSLVRASCLRWETLDPSSITNMHEFCRNALGLRHVREDRTHIVLVGNHPDELAPWLPMMAACSGPKVHALVIPCCPFTFGGPYTIRQAGMGRYATYVEYIRTIPLRLGLATGMERVRIPSTRNACVVALGRGLWPSVRLLNDALARRRCGARRVGTGTTSLVMSKRQQKKLARLRKQQEGGQDVTGSLPTCAALATGEGGSAATAVAAACEAACEAGCRSENTMHTNGGGRKSALDASAAVGLTRAMSGTRNELDGTDRGALQPAAQFLPFTFPEKDITATTTTITTTSTGNEHGVSYNGEAGVLCVETVRHALLAEAKYASFVARQHPCSH